MTQESATSVVMALVWLNLNHIVKISDIAKTLCARDYKGFGTGFDTMNGVLEMDMQIVGSLNPTKDCQDRVRVFGDMGICPGLRATDYKDPPKIAEGNMKPIKPHKKIIPQLICLGNVNAGGLGQFGYTYYELGLSPTIAAGTHGYCIGHILVKDERN